MADSGWWLPEPAHILEQGDIFSDIPFLMPQSPVRPLIRAQVKGGLEAWMVAPQPKPQKDHKIYFLTDGRLNLGMILNHGCDIEKATNKRLLFAAVTTLDSLEGKLRDEVILQNTKALMFLPGVPGIGDLVADLRVTTTVPRAYATSAAKAASMTPAGVIRTQAQLFRFFLRREWVAEELAGE